MTWAESFCTVFCCAFVVGFLMFVGECNHKSDQLKLECLKAGKLESECRFR